MKTTEIITQNFVKVGQTGRTLKVQIFTDGEFVTARVGYKGTTVVKPFKIQEGVMEKVGDWTAGKVMPIVLGMADFLSEK